MALEGKRTATGRGYNAPTLPVKTPNGCYFRNGDATAAATTVIKTMAGETVTVNDLPIGGIIDWVMVSEVVSTSATDYEIYLWK